MKIIQVIPVRVQVELADGELREAVIDIEVEAVGELLGLVKITGEDALDAADGGALIAGRAGGIVGGEGGGVSGGDGESHDGGIAFVGSGARSRIDAADALAGGELGLGECLKSLSCPINVLLTGH